MFSKFKIFLLVLLLLLMLLNGCDLNPGDVNDNLVVVDEDEIPSLYEKYNGYFPIGTAVATFEWNRTLDSHEDLIKKHFNSVTAENEMKPNALQPSEGQFNFEAADELIEFAKDNNMMVRGHTLVWHSQTPDWFFEGNDSNREELLNRMKDHIEVVMDKYKDDIYVWDVVNEAVADDGSLRDSPWRSIIGDDYIKEAFRFAHNADPDAKLFYNDYNATQPVKRDKIYEMLEALIKDDTPIHGMGIQAHWNIYWPSIDEIREAIEKYAELGLDIQITELDISMFSYNDHSRLDKPTDDMIRAQARRYREIFNLFRDYKDVITGVTFWGVADDVTWLDNYPVQDRNDWPLLFDENHQAKDAFWEVLDF